MAVTSDLGHPTDVHPRNKREVGRRLALWALQLCYEKELSYSGPLVRSVRRAGAALVVEFDHADGGLRTADVLDVRGFEFAGVDGVFQPGLALVTDEDVTLSSADVAAPVSARYGWPYAIGNMTNNAGLPASTFSESMHR
jgi:sialate O-acetylesterase